MFTINISAEIRFPSPTEGSCVISNTSDNESDEIAYLLFAICFVVRQYANFHKTNDKSHFDRFMQNFPWNELNYEMDT
ncbi:MAG: hypothetical protein ABIG42_10130, partial [bacterium]